MNFQPGLGRGEAAAIFISISDVALLSAAHVPLPPRSPAGGLLGLLMSVIDTDDGPLGGFYDSVTSQS